MVTIQTVDSIVGQVAKRGGLTSQQTIRLQAWANRWMGAFTNDREYNERAVRTMTANSAASIVAGDGNTGLRGRM